MPRDSTAQGSITVEMKLTGNRPSGQTPPASALVSTAQAAVKAAGLVPTLRFGSTRFEHSDQPGPSGDYHRLGRLGRPRPRAG